MNFLLKKNVYKYQWLASLVTVFCMHAVVLRLSNYCMLSSTMHVALYGALLATGIVLFVFFKNSFLQKIFFITICIWSVKFFGLAIRSFIQYKTFLSLSWFLFVIAFIMYVRTQKLLF